MNLVVSDFSAITFESSERIKSTAQIKCHIISDKEVYCNVLGEGTVTRISTLSGRGKGRGETCENIQIVEKNLIL